MKREDKASVSLKKILCISLIFFLFLAGMGVVAANANLNQVKIILSNGYEMDIVTTRTVVGEILEENHIILLPDEKVVPNQEEELSDNHTIRILKQDEEVEELAEESNEEINVDLLLEENYAPIVEKIITEQEIIPYETITKDVSGSSESKQDKVVQQGENGLREITYKTKYQNDVEIERVEISSVVIKEPVDKIVEVRTKTVTSRGSVSRTSVSGNASTLAASVAGIEPVVKKLNASAYTASTCGKSPSSPGYGRTASGAMAKEWYTVAAGKGYAIGTVMYIPYFKNEPNGGWFVVQDRGGAISNNRVDIYMGTYSECIQFGRRNLECYIYEK